MHSLLLAVMLGAGAPNAPMIENSDANPSVQRSLDVMHALLLNYWDQQQQSLTMQRHQGEPTATYWFFAEALNTVVDNASLLNDDSAMGWIVNLYEAQQARGFGQNFVYFDDLNWMAQALLRGSQQLQRSHAYQDRAQALQDAAQNLLAQIQAAEDIDAAGGSNGVWWNQDRQAKVTAINGGSVITACELFAVTQRERLSAVRPAGLSPLARHHGRRQPR